MDTTSKLENILTGSECMCVHAICTRAHVCVWMQMQYLNYTLSHTVHLKNGTALLHALHTRVVPWVLII